MTALFSPQYLKWQELAKIFSVNKNWWQALTALLSRSESSRQLPPSLALSHQGIQKTLKVVQYRTHGDSLNQAQINWRGFIVNRWLSSACFEPFSLNTSRGIFQGAQASPALLPWTNADLSGSRVGWQQLRLHGGAGAVFAGWALWPRPNPRAKVPHHPPVRPSVRPDSLATHLMNLLELTTGSPTLSPASGLLPKSERGGEGTVCTGISLQGGAESELKFAPTSPQLLARLPPS